MSKFTDYFPSSGGSGVGSGIPINSYAPFAVYGTSNPTGYDDATGLYTHPDGTFWVKTGRTISGVTSTYPNAKTNSGATAYSGFNFSAAGQISTTTSIPDVTFDGTNFYVSTETTDRIYQYDTAGVYTGFSFSVSAQNGFPRGVTNNATNIYMTGGTGNRVWKYDATGTYTGFNFAANVAGSGYGLSANSTHIFTNTSGQVNRFTLAGGLVNSFGVSSIRDTAADDSNVYTLNTGTRTVTEYTLAGAATGFTFSTATQSNIPYGISKYQNKFHVIDRTSRTVYEYETDLTVGDPVARTDTDTSQALFVRVG